MNAIKDVALFADMLALLFFAVIWRKDNMTNTALKVALFILAATSLLALARG